MKLNSLPVAGVVFIACALGLSLLACSGFRKGMSDHFAQALASAPSELDASTEGTGLLLIDVIVYHGAEYRATGQGPAGNPETCRDDPFLGPFRV